MLKKMKNRSYREEVNRLKRKVKVVKNEVSVRLKNRAEGGRTKNGTKVRLNNVRGNRLK